MNEAPETETRKSRGTLLGFVSAVIGAALSALFLLNFTMGVFEIPDNLPIIGNIDEAFATTILIASLTRLGIHLPINLDPRRKSVKQRDAQ